MVASRNLSLTVKKTTRSQKTLAANLERKRNGERISLSSRVAELDELVPEYLGVSKAVLESVIFCHQEDSLWPMAEPGALKKRFDDIFEAVKYTKAIDNIKLLRKSYAAQIKVLDEIEKAARANKNKGEKVEQNCTQLHDQLDELRAKSESLGAQMTEAQTKASEALRKSNELGGLVGRLEALRIEKRAKAENVQRLRRNLKEFEESDEELQAMLEQYEDRVGTLKKTNEEQKERYLELQNDLQEVRVALSAKERELGSHEAEKASHERQLDARQRLIKQTARSHNIRGFDLEIDEDQVQAFMDKITKMTRDQNATFERARRETQEELQTARRALTRINEQKLSLNQRKESARSTISTNDRKINGLQSDINRIEVDEGGKTNLESTITDIEYELHKLKSDADSAEWDTKVDGVEKELHMFDMQKEKLDAELVEGTKRAGDTARLDFSRKELKDRQRSLQTMTGAHGQKIGKVVGSTWTAATLEKDFQQALDGMSSQVVEAERQRDGTSREMEQLNFKLNTCRADLKRKRQDLSQADKAIRDAIDDDPINFPASLNELEKANDIIKSDTTSYGAMEEYYQKSIDTANEHNMCRLCRRGFDKDKRAFQEFLKYLQAQHLKAQTGTNAEEAQDIESELKSAKAVQPD